MRQREMDVLNILFSNTEPMTASEVVSKMQDLTQSTVTVALRNLLNSGYVEVIGKTYSGTVLSRTYRPTEKAREAVVEHLLEEYESIRSVISPKELCDQIQKRFKD